MNPGFQSISKIGRDIAVVLRVRVTWQSKSQLVVAMKMVLVLSLISPLYKAILIGLFIFVILLILYVILWYICRDIDCEHGI
ncbi:hypothetical protein PGIGA_G00209840 [Pangasianodon gigas]|uniref:Uncharacterized protein n=1 Tax=Pangasianodon gigas TaxID=30993 RepID=A0ACC5WH67_PANGG|nr:hypothetical protein [Pangasianodon gigas]